VINHPTDPGTAYWFIPNRDSDGDPEVDGTGWIV
jgi:hypothetical protein